jgi:membrane fusion protein, heavy metal efflux system
VRSPIAGHVVASPIFRGQSVDSNTLLFRVADLSRLWIELAVFEQDIANVHSGDMVDITLQRNATARVEGKVSHVGDVIDQATRSGSVRVVVPNADGALRPGQSVLARIRTQAPQRKSVLVPREALTLVDGKPTLFVRRMEQVSAPSSNARAGAAGGSMQDAVESRTVTSGAQDGASVEILTGLSAGEWIVVRGVFALKSEIFR